MKTPPPLLLAILVLTAWTATAQNASSPNPAALKPADRLFKDQNWAEARAAYDKARDQERDWHAPAMRRAVEGAAACAVNLAQWDDAARHLEDYIAHNQNRVEEVAGQRLLAALCSNALDREMSGSESDRLSDAGPKAADGLDAAGRLEHARDAAAGLLAALPADADASARQRITKEWIGSDVDLATLLTREKGRLRDDDSDWWLDSVGAGEDRDPADDDPETSLPAASRRYPGHRAPPPGLPRQPDSASCSRRSNGSTRPATGTRRRRRSSAGRCWRRTVTAGIPPTNGWVGGTTSSSTTNFTTKSCSCRLSAPRKSGSCGTIRRSCRWAAGWKSSICPRTKARWPCSTPWRRAAHGARSCPGRGSHARAITRAVSNSPGRWRSTAR